MIDISVIVPAYNEEKYIAKCLEALERQDFPKDQYETLVINNNSTDKTKETASGFSHVTVIDEPTQGYVHALIRGCKQARGSIFVFTDADTTVPTDWLTKYWHAYQDERVVCAGGPGYLQPKLWCTSLLEFVFYWGGRMWKVANGFNVSVRRSAYKQIDGFDPKINFNADAYLILQAKKLGTMVFLRDNWVCTSSRRWRKVKTLWYLAKTLTNIIALMLLGRTVFYEFGNVRE